MQKINNQDFLYSPSDLVTYVESPFASIMDRLVCEGKIDKKLKNNANEDAAAQLVIQRGFNHEHQQTQKFKNEGKRVLEIDNKAPDKQQTTLEAMQQGYEVIAQAYLVHESFAGYADFLVKVQGQSLLGNYHYEVWDTKLAHQVKPTYLIQLCCYAEMLKHIQGILPKFVTVALGKGEPEKFKTIDCFAYYQAIKKAFLQQQQSEIKYLPNPANYKNWGQWSQYAQNLLKEKDHIFQVANISYRQMQKLQAANIHTLLALAESSLDSVKDISPSSFERLKKQAQLQKQSTENGTPKFEVLTQADNVAKGLALLPKASPLDIFFDIEGFPHQQDGLEYLWGVTYFDEDNQRCFKRYWAHDREQEKQAFEEFIKWTYARWQQDNTMHIYHYAPYEVTACRKLMGRFGVCEQEVDDLLRHGVFIDLYKIVKSGLLVGTPNYSIKSIERLYRSERQGEVANGGDSIVAYENYRNALAVGDTTQANAILKNIRAYNKDDCDSTQELTAWLRQLQQENGISYQTPLVNIEQKELTDEQRAVLALRDSLLTQAQAIKQSHIQQAQHLENLAHLLEFHRREDKPKWWRHFDRIDATEQELWDDLDCLAMCQRTEKEAFKPTPRARNLAYEYCFDTRQEFKGASDSFYVLSLENAEGKPVSVSFLKEHSNFNKGIITLQSNQNLPEIITLTPNDYVNPQPIPRALQQVIEAINHHSNLEHCAIQQFLAKQKPTITGHTGGTIVNTTDSKERLQQIIQTVKNLQNSYLVIQGPPGAGKSYTAKHIITELLKDGKKIGISSNSHKAINHLLLTSVQYCQSKGIQATFVCSREDEHLTKLGVCVTDNSDLHTHLQNACVLGTTAWGFAREDMINQLDYLFVDEAGQVAVANLIAMSRSAKNLILMGDQMQLSQPSQGSHPLQSGLSVLDYFLHNTPTIPDDMGIFLNESYRMHMTVNQFISDYIYDGKLCADVANNQQIIHLPSNSTSELPKEAGIIFVPVEHQDNKQASDEEVNKILQLVDELLQRQLTTKQGETRPVTLEDMLFIAPYNHQVRKLQDKLGSQAKVGSVDKFQGQEAPIVFLSLCSSDANDSPRGLEFIFNKNRLNVAISRAKSLAIVVANPQLAITHVNTVEQLKMVNLVAALFEYSC